MKNAIDPAVKGSYFSKLTLNFPTILSNPKICLTKYIFCKKCLMRKLNIKKKKKSYELYRENSKQVFSTISIS